MPERLDYTQQKNLDKLIKRVESDPCTYEDCSPCEVQEDLIAALKAVMSERDELRDRIEWLETHGPNCKCRECYISWGDDG